MRFYKNNDCWAWAAEEDAVALDIYPDPRDEEAHIAAALNFDLMRSRDDVIAHLKKTKSAAMADTTNVDGPSVTYHLPNKLTVPSRG